LSQWFRGLPRALDVFEKPANVITQTLVQLCSLRGFCESQATTARSSHPWRRIPRPAGPLARPAIVLFSKIVAQDRSNGCTLLNIPGHKMDGLVAFFSVLSLPSPALLFRAITANYTQPCALCMPWRTPIATASLEPGVLAMAEHHPSTHLPSYKAIWPESTGPMSQTPELILVPTMNPHWTRTFNRWAPVIVMSLPIRTLSEAPSCKASNPSMTLRDNSEQSSQSTCSRNGPHGFQDPEYRYDFPASVIMHC
jgi:hypothetical protein